MRVLRLERRGLLAGGDISHILEGHEFLWYGLERLWADNTPSVSHVPDGDYKCVFEWSNKFQRMLYELKDVPGRTECKFHPANWAHELQGCIALGRKLGDENMPINESGEAIDELHLRMDGQPFLLEVRHGFAGVDGAEANAAERDRGIPH